ncbi:MAG: nitrate reductase molybdenum cofactor assembly chaperone [Alphaproteobacteria bacterium]
MGQAYKLLSLLLSYPGEDLVAAAPVLRRAVAGDSAIPARLKAGLTALVDDLGRGDPFDAQERYVALFDRSRSLSLHLFEHVHGEGRDRGQAMVDLAELYRSHGLAIEARELPDYLPLFLEFLSTLPPGEARALLAETGHVLAALFQRHRKRGTAYAVVFETLSALAGASAGPTDEQATAPDEDPDDLGALDRAWEEEAVTFGPGAAGSAAPDGACPAARAVLARMDAAPHGDAA